MTVDYDPIEVGRIIETHEAQVWAACMDAAASVTGNPLKVDVDRSGNTPLCTLAALNFGIFNRVIALGVVSPATDEDIDSLENFYALHSQSRYLVEVTPVSQPLSLVESLERRGYRPTVERDAKCWRTLNALPTPRTSVSVKELTEADREQVSDVNIAAWKLPSFFDVWFGATLGRDGFRHYGSFDGDLLVSTVAMHVAGDVAWTGFGATRPEYQGRGYQTARLFRLIEDAAAMGCRVIHNETSAGTPEAPNMSLHNILKMGFNRIYDKEFFAPSRK
jgi:GNAT superfamily N-acetyltransferase